MKMCDNLSAGRTIYNKMVVAASNEQVRYLTLDERAYKNLLFFLWDSGTVRKPAIVWGLAVNLDRPAIPIYVIINDVPRLYAKEGIRWN